jgi:hypothetical protein
MRQKMIKIIYILDQGSQTRIWPARCICSTCECLKITNFGQILLILRAFLVLQPAKAFFSYKLGSTEHFFEMWPSNRFEFETPVLDFMFQNEIREENEEFRFFTTSFDTDYYINMLTYGTKVLRNF